jgi:hypothetical protein
MTVGAIGAVAGALVALFVLPRKPADQSTPAADPTVV